MLNPLYTLPGGWMSMLSTPACFAEADTCLFTNVHRAGPSSSCRAQ